MFRILFTSMLVSLFSFNVFANEKPSEEMMKKWQEYSTPSAAHKFFSTLAGKWTYTQKLWHSKDSKPEESTGRATMKMIFGGRYLQQDITGKAMGQPYEGMGLTGYDNLKKETISTWADNMGTSIMYGVGKLDLDKKTVSEKGEYTCPMEKDGSAKYRSEWVLVDPNTMTFTMFSDQGGNGEFKMMEMTYKRAK